MSTRRKRFASDESNFVSTDRGLLANHVAARCEKLSAPDEIAVVWWLQQLSWRAGGLEAFAKVFLAEHASELGTLSMQRFGMKPRQVYTAEQIKVIRDEFPSRFDGKFPLRGEVTRLLTDFLSDRPPSPQQVWDAQKWPTSYTVEEVRSCCSDPANFADELKDICLRRDRLLSKGTWNFPELFSALCAARLREGVTAKGKIVETTVTRMVADELDFALFSRDFVVIEGREGIGKSEAAKNWCERHPGRAVYIRLDSGADEMSLYQAFARALGTACSTGYQASQVKARVQDALRSGHLIAVIDEAHFLWPPSARSRLSAPKRIEWVRTGLIDFKVPVALISTPQHFGKQCALVREAGWNINQLERRLSRTARLPEVPPADDSIAIAMHHFPNVSARDAKRIAGVALATPGFLTTISHLRKRVDFFLDRDPSADERSLLDRAITEKCAEFGITLPSSGKSELAAPALARVPTEPTVPPSITSRARNTAVVAAGR